MSQFDGKWAFVDVPDEFIEIMKKLGYNALQRKWLKTKKLSITTKYDVGRNAQEVVVSAGGGLYKRKKDFVFDGLEREFIDEDGNRIAETAKWIGEEGSGSMEVKSVFLDLNITIWDRREIVTGSHPLEVFSRVMLTEAGVDKAIETEVSYVKKGL